MAIIQFPEKLSALLSQDHHLNGWITPFAQRIGEILRGNELTFFPGFTDHGIDHIESVLRTEVELVPDEVWEKGILKAADAAVIVGGTLLHDLAMHLHQRGFLELVQPGSRWKPLRWFDQTHEGHLGDRLWSDLWEEYEREARKLSDRALGDIIGLDAVREGWKFTGLPQNGEPWNDYLKLVVGEFIRRHHARLAHEVAMYGFPGLEAGGKDHQFPVLAEAQEELADLVGLSARSHGMHLRVCMSYLEAIPTYAGTLTPMGASLLYPMALLRVADYLQIEGKRAPAVLLQLKEPQSPVSVKEWQTHKAVLSVTQAKDPAGKKITVSNKISLEVFLQLRDLMAGLQREMDHSTAVLEEAYGRCVVEGLSELKLKYRRVYSNVNDPAFQRDLPYVPERTGFSADPNLLPLLVEPLYGAYPGVGVRELMQNAVDAVRELDVWCKTHNKRLRDLDLPKLAENAEVLIDFVRQSDGNWDLRVQDRGIGMTTSTLQNYFLRAGASFRHSPEWAKQYMDKDGKPKVLRSGRFGIGAFALFLLGPEFKLTTRHAGEDCGHCIDAKMGSRLIEIRPNASAKVGTVIEVRLREDAVDALNLKVEIPDFNTDWFSQRQPKVVRRLGKGKKFKILKPAFEVDAAKPEAGWMTIFPKGYSAVHWTFTRYPALTCNGIRIASPTERVLKDADIHWPIHQYLVKLPSIAVDDSANGLPVTTQRYGLLTPQLPFLSELAKDVMLSFIAHTLILGPRDRLEALSYGKERNQFPLCEGPDKKDAFRRDERRFLDRWIATDEAFVPFDPWLLKLLASKSLLVCGGGAQSFYEKGVFESFDRAFSDPLTKEKIAVLKWNGSLTDSRFGYREMGLIAERHPLIWKEGKREYEIDWISAESVLALGCLPQAFEIVIAGDKRGSLSRESVREFAGGRGEKNDKWKLVENESENGSAYFSMKKGEIDSRLSLLDLSRKILEAIGPERSKKGDRDRHDPVVHVATLNVSHEASQPEFIIAQVWNEVLGRRAVPFESKARGELIEHGRKHPDLRRHIEAWEAMKKAQVSWVKIGESNES